MLEFITSSTMLLTAVIGANTEFKTAATSTNATNSPQILVLDVDTTHATKPISLEEYVRNYFKDTPVMAEVARCESHFRQFEKNGDILRGRSTPEDVGVMQINERYHLEDSKKLGFNIHTLDGNLGYAKHLYNKQGASPWVHSSKCWGVTKAAVFAKW